MNRTILRKINRDLWTNFSRTMLVIIAIALGVTGVGFVTDTYGIIKKNIDLNYEAVNPASAYIWLEKSGEKALYIARGMPEIKAADKARQPIRCRVEVEPGRFEVLLLFVVEDFNDLKVGKFFTEAGKWPPEKGEVLIERNSMQMINGEIGKTMSVKPLNSDAKKLQISGVVFDPSPDPAWVSNTGIGYISPETQKLLGGAEPIQGIQVIVQSERPDRGKNRDVANNLGEELGKQGYNVLRVEVPIPGKYQQTDKTNSILTTIGIFGALSLILSGLITAILFSSLMSQQIRQIGVMKALGASSRQIFIIYMAMVLSMAVPALVIGIAFASSLAKGFAVSIIEMLNFNVLSLSMPQGAVLLQILFGILIPAAAAFVPLYRASRITVLEAISDYGVNTKDFGSSRTDAAIMRIKNLPRILLLSLRNAFRKRGRLILTLAMLAIGGASFISAIGASASWNKSIDQSFSNINYDIDIRLAKNYAISDIEKSIRSVSGVKSVEAWGYAMSNAFPKYKDGTYGSYYIVFAPKNGSEMINPPVVSGRWLKEDDTNAVVLDTDFVDNADKLGMPVNVGDDIILNLSGKDIQFRVVGIMDKVGSQSAAYVNYNYFSEATGQTGKAMCARVIIEDKAKLDEISQLLDQKLTDDNINVFVTRPLTVSKRIMVNHVILILVSLLAMTALTAIVGALGLSASIGLNVLERRREFGIMRSVGASSRRIIHSVITEGMVTAIISWLLAIIISVPMTAFIALTTGGFIFPRIMQISYPIWAPMSWLGIVLIISAFASLIPALKASKLTIREVLNYE